MTVTDRAGLITRRIDSPLGELELWASAAGLRAVLWPGEDGARVARSLSPSAMAGPGADAGGVGAPPAGAPAAPDSAGAEPDTAATRHLDRAERQLTEYFAGTRRDFDLDLDLAGTAFQRSAWDVLRTIPYGSTMSYGEQAAALGDPAKARAVGAANGRNPVSIVVPCHRVVAAGGALTGFAGGLDTKAWLLDHERRVLAEDVLAEDAPAEDAPAEDVPARDVPAEDVPAGEIHAEVRAGSGR
jgi:methylated-DNA-[protein]-cysteine S-methyltransferase